MAASLTKTDIIADIATARRYVADNWGWFLALGIVFVVAGLAAIAFPLVTTIAAKIFLGWLFLIGGVMLIVHGLSVRRWSGMAWNFVIGLLYVVVGGYLAFFPLAGIVTLTILLAALFIAEGVAEIIMGVKVRPHDGWMLLVVSGVIAIVAGVLITLGLPDSAEWAIGLLVGLNLLFTGWTYIFLALSARQSGA